MYEMGWGVPRDINEARRLYALAANAENAGARRNLERLAALEKATRAAKPGKPSGRSKAKPR